MTTVVSSSSDTGTRPTSMLYQSTNGQKYEDSSDEEPEVRMRVGEMYQAKVPEWVADAQKTDTHEGMRIWSPFHNIPDEKVEAYCKIAKEKHGYNVEQALGLLFWHKHDVDKALKDIANFTPMPDDWSVEDKVLFEQAYTFHGKSFRRIQQLLPDKEINQLVKYYYLWKKTRTKTSLMDRQARKLNKPENASDESDNDDNHPTFLQGKSHQESKLILGKPDQIKEDEDVKHKLPKGIHLDIKNISEITEHFGGSEKYLKKLDADITALKSQIQVDKQHWSLLCEQLRGIDEFLNLVTSQTLENNESLPSWTNEELLLAVQGVRRYGKDFQAISEVLGTKTAGQVKSFFAIQRRRFNLDQVLREYEEAEAGNKGAVPDSSDASMDTTQENSINAS